MSEQILKALDRYYNAFDDSFPMAAMSGVGENDVIEMIDKCIAQRKDVYDLGYLSVDEIY